ncbi:class II aldolase/adducin family protein [Lactovum odontotermitis]
MYTNEGKMLFQNEREELSKLVRIITERGLTNAAGGNFSFLTEDESGKKYIIMTPSLMSESFLGTLPAAQILVVDFDTPKIIDGVGKLTREINMHQAIYHANTNTKAIIHSHAPNTLFWATANVPIPNLTESTQKVKAIPILDFAPACSLELAENARKYIEENQTLPQLFMLNSHGVLIAQTGVTGVHAIHSALAILETNEMNAEIAYKQTVLQGLGIIDGYYSKGDKIATLEDLKKKTAIYNRSENLGGD